jgi:mannose-1-phosphate guanylyltransferase
VAKLTPYSFQWVVCGSRHEAAVRNDLPELPARNILVEPMGRNTAPCIGLACIHVIHQDPDAVLAVMPADAYVPHAELFCSYLSTAARSAVVHGITTLGLRPTRPETGYGYIQYGSVLQDGAHQVHAVARFVEKPNRLTAEQYIADGTYLWNAGIFVFRAQQMLHAIKTHMPALHQGLMRLDSALESPAYASALKEVYPTLPSQSIDYGVMEKESGLAVVPSAFEWNDVGSHAALPDVLPTDAQGNLARGQVLLIEAQGCIVDGRAGRLCALMGVKDLVVVDTTDALLVIPRERAQHVGQILELLKARGREDLL